ncbi:MAG: cytochrome c1 [Gammaproteobacteria bacterium]|jgi:ubiquinol-cytochrome c reductase cytochrome c1 subunit
MNKKILILLLMCFPIFVHASEEGNEHLMKADVNLENKNSLRHGFKLFVNYCMSCHSAKYMRYTHVARDLGLSKEQMENNLMFVSDFTDPNKPDGVNKKLGALMTVAMTEKQGKQWFGNPPPDLTLVARVRGADWLYTYLNSFYLDPKRPTGANNTLFKNVGMPDVLWQLHGLRRLKTEKEANGTEKVSFEQVTKGTMNEVEYHKATNDLVNFLVYLGEPVKMERQHIGILVMFFLVIFFIFAYLLKKEYWKDVH